MVGQLKKLFENDNRGKYGMGKNKKKKRNKKHGIYNKKQFHSIVCMHCALCSVYNPQFCYESVYRQEPSRFMSYCYTKLLCTAHSLGSKGFKPKDLNIGEFRGIFCHSGICTGKVQLSCKNSLQCFADFKNQIKGAAGPLKRFKNKLRNNDTEYIYKAYPTFFISNNEEWKARVKEILEGDNRDREQNQSKESSK